MLSSNLPQNPPLIIEAKRSVAGNLRSPYYLVAYTKLREGKKLVKTLKKKSINCYVIKGDSFSFWPRMLYVHKTDCERALKIILRDYSDQVVGVYPHFSSQNGSVAPSEIKRLIQWKTESEEESVPSESFSGLPSLGIKEKSLMSSIVVSALRQIKYNQYGVFLTLLRSEIEALSEDDFKNSKSVRADRKMLLDEVETLVKIIATQQYASLMPDLLKLKQDIENKVKDWDVKSDRRGLLSWVGAPKPEK
jgi:hypothetical protein